MLNTTVSRSGASTAAALGQTVRVGSGRDRQIVRLSAVAIALPNFLIRADSESADRGLGVRAPLPQRLSDERDRGSDEQHTPARPGDLLGGAERGEGLARAAGHDQLAAVVLCEPREHVVEGALLVRPHLLAGPLLKRCGLVVEVGVPVDRRGLETEQIETLHGGPAVAERPQEIVAPIRSGADDDEFVEARVVPAKERLDIGLVERAVGVVALALQGGQAAVSAFGDDVAPVVAAVPAGPFVPVPDRCVAVPVLSISRQYLLDERLELAAPLPRVGIALAQYLVDIAERRWHGASGRGLQLTEYY